jgi:hypothetical protein
LIEPELRIVKSKFIFKLLIFFILLLSWHQTHAQGNDVARVSSKASISATIVSVVDHNRDLVCFGTQIQIQIPGYLAGYLKGSAGNLKDVEIKSFSSSLVLTQEETKDEAGQKDLSQLISLSDKILRNSVQDWLEKPDVVTSGTLSPEMVCSYTVGNQFNFEENIVSETNPTATIQITVNYN